MPTRITHHSGSTWIAWSRSGIAATIIQSTTASRPIRAASSCATRVEKVLVMRPSNTAVRQFRRASTWEGPGEPRLGERII
jgi:hypothetical protein